MRFLLNDRTGSVSVLLVVILTIVVMAIGTITEVIAGKTARSYGNSILDLAGRSVLSEYDRSLRDKYGLFGMLTNSEKTEKRIVRYAGEAFRTNDETKGSLRLRIQEIRVDLSTYSLISPDLLEEQILQEMYGYGAKKILSLLDLREKQGQRSTLVDREVEDKETRQERVLRNTAIRNALPSEQYEDLHSFSIDRVKTGMMGELLKAGGELYEDVMLNLYIVRYFRDRTDSAEWEDTFFCNEVEYILFGQTSDSVNRLFTKAAVVAFRTAMNFEHIMMDQEKREAIKTLALIMTPGPEAAATQLALAGIWAGAEALIDAEELESGRKIQLLKTKESWILSLDTAIEGNGGSHKPTNEDAEGLSYEGYLLLFLFACDKETKLVRVMDLIQLNLAGGCNSAFRMSNCFSGFSYMCRLEREGSYLGIASKRSGVFEGSHVY